jgi:putrescine aminotransferase
VGGTLNNAQTFRLEPPAVISYEQIDQVVDRLAGVLEDVRAQVGSGSLATVH